MEKLIMEKQVKVKKEKMATRCEICHQSDLFDPQTENCLRCSQVEKALEAKPQIIRSLWSPRFALIERDPQSFSCKNTLYLIFGVLIGLPIAIVLGNIIYIIAICFSTIILGFIYLWKRYDIGKIVNTSLPKNHRVEPTITTLFDKYPEEERFDREGAYNEPQITTLFGDNNKKDRQ